VIKFLFELFLVNISESSSTLDAMLTEVEEKLNFGEGRSIGHDMTNRFGSLQKQLHDC
jgi:hypothetical protein